MYNTYRLQHESTDCDVGIIPSLDKKLEKVTLMSSELKDFITASIKDAIGGKDDFEIFDEILNIFQKEWIVNLKHLEDAMMLDNLQSLNIPTRLKHVILAKLKLKDGNDPDSDDET